jgi:hypothetical protein
MLASGVFLSMIALLMSWLPIDYSAHDPLLSLRKRASRKGPLLLLCAGAFVLSLTAAFAVKAGDDMPNCHVESAVLAYPRYTNKGLIDDYLYRCGKPDGSCRLRTYTAKGPVYDCSPFALGGRNAVM